MRGVFLGRSVKSAAVHTAESLAACRTLIPVETDSSSLSLLVGAAADLSSPVPRKKALYSELPKPTRIGHSIGHQV